MSLEIVQTEVTPVSITISANMPVSAVYWYSLTYRSEGFRVLSIENSPSAIYIDCSASTFEWGNTAISCEYYDLTSHEIRVFNPSFAIMASLSSIPFETIYENEIDIINPYIIINIPILEIDVVNISLKENKINLKYNINSEIYDISAITPSLSFTWNIDPWKLIESVDMLSSSHIPEFTYNESLNMGYLITNIESINFIIPSAYNDFIAHNVSVSAELYGIGFSAQNNITFNDIISINISEQTSSSLIAKVYRGSESLPINEEIYWGVNPNSNIFFYTNNVPYINDTIDIANNIGIIHLSAINITNDVNTDNHFANTYSFYVSSITENMSAMSTFRPYIGYTEISELTSISLISPYNDLNRIINYVKILGVTDNNVHNINPNYYLVYNSDNNIEFFNLNLNRIFAPIFVNMGDEIRIDIINVIVDNIEELQINAYNIEVNLLSSSNINDSIDSYNFEVSGVAFPSDSLFKSVLNIEINGENFNNKDVEYINLNSVVDIILSIHESSILEPNDISGIVEFRKNNILLYSDVFSDKNDLLNKIYIDENVDISNPVEIDYKLIIKANYYENFQLIQKENLIKLVFLEIPSIENSNIIAYPKYTWLPYEGWERRVNEDFSLNEIPGSILYGHGRTENILLSTNITSNVAFYNWTIYRNGINVEQRQTPSNKLWIPIKTLNDMTTIDVGLEIITTFGLLINEHIHENVLLFAPISNLDISEIEIISINNLLFSIPGKIEFDIIINNTKQYPVIIDSKYVNMIIESDYWTNNIGIVISNNKGSTPIINSDDVAQKGFLPWFKSSELDVVLYFNPKLKYVHPEFNDWGSFESIQANSDTFHITGYPVSPVYYTANKFIISDSSIKFDNLAQLYPDILFNWNLNNNSLLTYSTEAFIVSGLENGVYELRFSTNYNDNDLILIDPIAINVLDSYPVYDQDITRRVNDKISDLPYRYNIGNNEWFISTTINNVFENIYNNMIYLLKQSNVNLNPPTKLIGWLGSYELKNNEKVFRWFVDIPKLNYYFNDPSIVVSDNNRFNNVQDCIVRDNIMYVANTTSVYILSSDFFATLIDSKDGRGIGSPFNFINTIQLDSVDKNRIYLLDTKDSNGTSKNMIMVFRYQYNTWELLYSWGGLGSASLRYKFNNPMDMIVDKSNIIWVADTDNFVIKKFTRTGLWLNTIESTYFNDRKPLSLCKDSNDHLQVLCNDNSIVVFNNDGIKQYHYNINELSDNLYFKIREAYDEGFVYIVSNNSIIKSTIDGKIQMGFNDNEIIPGFNFNNRNVYHDEFRNLYICQSNFILKYYDQINYISLVDNSIYEKMWELNDILIKKDEYIQDWVINKSLNRLWDNIELIRRSILGKLSFKRNIRPMEPMEPMDSQYFINDEDTLQSIINENICKIDWLPKMHAFRAMPEMLINQFNCFIVPAIRTFFSTEYIIAAYSKEEVIVGINELVSADVLNRCFNMLYENLLVIKHMLRQSNDKIEELCDLPVIIEPSINIDKPSINIDKLYGCYPELKEINFD